jgi:hypothetical protein
MADDASTFGFIARDTMHSFVDVLTPRRDCRRARSSGVDPPKRRQIL